MKCGFETVKSFAKPELNKDFLTPTEVEIEVENMCTSRSCPTGYKENELKDCSTIELLNLRKITFEYLRFRSSKTRNVQFVFLIKRINKELSSRNVDCGENIRPLEYITVLNSNCSNNCIEGEYSLLKRKHANDRLGSSDGSEETCDNSSDHSKNKHLSIFTKYFSFVNQPKKIEIPSFLHDKLDKFEITTNNNNTNLIHIKILHTSKNFYNSTNNSNIISNNNHFNTLNTLKQPCNQLNDKEEVFMLNNKTRNEVFSEENYL